MPWCLKNSKESIVVPVSKERNRNLSNPDNYRGISLTFVMCKLFESLLLIKYGHVSGDKQHTIWLQAVKVHSETLNDRAFFTIGSLTREDARQQCMSPPCMKSQIGRTKM